MLSRKPNKLQRISKNGCNTYTYWLNPHVPYIGKKAMGGDRKEGGTGKKITHPSTQIIILKCYIMFYPVNSKDFHFNLVLLQKKKLVQMHI